jgi:hypothetical protein
MLPQCAELTCVSKKYSAAAWNWIKTICGFWCSSSSLIQNENQSHFWPDKEEKRNLKQLRHIFCKKTLWRGPSRICAEGENFSEKDEEGE